MEFPLGIGIFVLGAVSGGLIILALMSDRPRYASLHSVGDDVEQRARRVQ